MGGPLEQLMEEVHVRGRRLHGMGSMG